MTHCLVWQDQDDYQYPALQAAAIGDRSCFLSVQGRTTGTLISFDSKLTAEQVSCTTFIWTAY